MTGSRHTDEHPGRLPEIRAEGDSVIYEFGPASGKQGARLIVRCDEAGNVWARMAPVAARRT